jgi:hypothetical protein
VQHLTAGPESQYGPPPALLQRKRDDRRRKVRSTSDQEDPEADVGLNKVIRVVSSGDLSFSITEQLNGTNQETMVFPAREEGLICMTTPGFTVTLVVLLAILVASCLTSAFLCIKTKPFSLTSKEKALSFPVPAIQATVSTIQQHNTVRAPPKKKLGFYS